MSFIEEFQKVAELAERISKANITLANQMELIALNDGQMGGADDLAMNAAKEVYYRNHVLTFEY